MWWQIELMGENWFFCFTSVVLCALPSAARRTSGVPMQTLSFTSHLVQKRHVPLHHRQISETSSKSFFFFVFCWLVECISQKDARKNNHLCKGNIIFLGTHIRNKMFGCSQEQIAKPTVSLMCFIPANPPIARVPVSEAPWSENLHALP